MNTPITAAERVRRSRWAGQVEAAANKLHQLLLEAPIPMPREPIIDMDLIDGLIELCGYEGSSPSSEDSRSKVKFQTPVKNQRDWMKEVAKELGFQRAACIARYAELDEMGVAPRKSRTIPSYDYAEALWQDGVNKGWLAQGNKARQRGMQEELTQVDRRTASECSREELVEVSKVESRLKLWAKRQHQINAQILNAYLKLDASGGVVREVDLRKNVDPSIDFQAHFNQMRMISPRNHGKVFEVKSGVVSIWSKVEHAVRLYRKQVQLDIGDHEREIRHFQPKVNNEERGMPRRAYSREEIVLCTYIARFGGSLFTESKIAKYGRRPKGSVKMKVQNIVAMLDEKGIARCPDIKPLSGRPPGESGRETNWPQVELLATLEKSELWSMCKEILIAERFG